MDDAAWAALTLSLTVLGGIWTWFSFRRRGVGSGLRALAFTLLPLAAYLTKTLQMFTGIVNEVTDWAAHLVFSPVVWLGVIVAGVSVVLFVVSAPLRARELSRGKAAKAAAKDKTGSTPAVGAGRQGGTPAIAQDDDMAEIEALLRKRGIS